MSAIKFWGAVVALLSGPTTTIVLLVVGLPGTLGDAMTWLFDWLPSTGTFIAEHAGYLTPAWALSLFGAALLGWLHLPEIRRNRLAQRTGFTRELAFPTGLYVGTMNVDASHLETEFYLEIAILGFNGTGGAISIDAASGSVSASTIDANQPTNQIDLPQAVVMHERTTTHDIGNLNQFFVVLYQRISRTNAERFSTMLENGGQINLYFGALDVTAHAVEDPAQSARLPIWAGVCLRKVPERILTDKIAMGSANLVIGSPQRG